MLEDRYALLRPKMTRLRWMGYKDSREVLLVVDRRLFYAWVLIEWVRDIVEDVFQPRYGRNSLGRLLKCV